MRRKSPENFSEASGKVTIHYVTKLLLCLENMAYIINGFTKMSHDDNNTCFCFTRINIDKMQAESECHLLKMNIISYHIKKQVICFWEYCCSNCKRSYEKQQSSELLIIGLNAHCLHHYETTSELLPCT